MLGKQGIKTKLLLRSSSPRDRMIYSVHPPVLLVIHIYTLWIIRSSACWSGAPWAMASHLCSAYRCWYKTAHAPSQCHI